MSSFVEVFEDNEENYVLNHQCKEPVFGKTIDTKDDETSFSVIMANTIVHPESSTKSTTVLSALKSANSKSFLGNDSINSSCSLNTVILTPATKDIDYDHTVPCKDNDNTTPSSGNFIRKRSPLSCEYSLNDITKSNNDDTVTTTLNDDSTVNEESAVIVEEATTEENISEEERIRRDIEASERLAWELLRQESQETYEMQLQYMRENAGVMSQEDYEAISQLVTEESNHNQFVASNEEENEEDNDDNDNSDPDNWDYERLLALGQAIGDVKTERWRLRAPAIIESLPKMTYDEILQTANNTNNGQGEHKKIRLDHRCAICMDSFSDEPTQILNLLSCGHYFHTNCASGWISSNNCCPVCKLKVVESPVTK